MGTLRLIRPVQRRVIDLDRFAVERVWGRLAGTAGPDDGVLTLPAGGVVEWQAGFEIYGPADPAARRAILIEAENRGRPRCLGLLQGSEFPTRAPDDDAQYALGDGFLFRRGFGYARIQWQYGFADLPADGQGAAFALMRDFARAVRDGTMDPAVPAWRRAYLGGYSQGGRFIRAFLREGFNWIGPDEPLFVGLLCMVAGAGMLPANRIAADRGAPPDTDDPAAGDVPPFTWDAILADHAVGEKVFDIFTTTEYVNRRGSLVTQDPATLPPQVRHYDLAGTTHMAYGTNGEAGLSAPEAQIWRPMSEGGWNANGGTRVPLNYVRIGPFLRAALVNLDAWVDAGTEPPPSQIHPLRPAEDSELGNPLPGTVIQIPQSDALGNPVGGIRPADVEVPLGCFSPAWLSGDNRLAQMMGGFTPLPRSELLRRYPTREAYITAYLAHLDRLIAGRFLLPEDREMLVAAAGEQYDRLTAKEPVAGA